MVIGAGSKPPLLLAETGSDENENGSRRSNGRSVTKGSSRNSVANGAGIVVGVLVAAVSTTAVGWTAGFGAGARSTAAAGTGDGVVVANAGELFG